MRSIIVACDGVIVVNQICGINVPISTPPLRGTCIQAFNAGPSFYAPSPTIAAAV
jgi:hypothetical protein